MQQPVGPCYSITPWNFPMAMGTRKIGPAIAAGCTMVIKPAKQTPLSMFALAQILEEAGLPGGVLNVVTVEVLGRRLEAAHRRPAAAQAVVHRLDRGRPQADRAVRRDAAALSMELGGNAPFLVFDDADVDAAVEGAMIAKMRNIGEACTAANRFHVADRLRDEFTEKLAAKLGDDEGRPRHRGRTSRSAR